MDVIKKYPTFFGIIALCLVIFIAGLVFMIISAGSVGEAKARYEQADRTYRAALGLNPAPTAQNVESSAQHVVAREEALEKQVNSIRGKASNLLRAQPPTDPTTMQVQLETDVTQFTRDAANIEPWGAQAGQVGITLPDFELPASDGTAVNLSQLPGRAVIYAYPMTATPGVALPDGWDMIPGARGCTPQACAFRDHAADLAELGVKHLFGVSTQTTAEQAEVVYRLHLPFRLLSDAALRLADALRLPVMEVEGRPMLRRLTLIASDGIIRAAQYPVFPPDTAPASVRAWLEQHPAG